MATAIGWILTLGPVLLAIFKKVLPKLLPKIGTLINALLAKGGVFAIVVGLVTKIWGWLSRFPLFLKGLFGAGGLLFFVRPFLEFLLKMFKTPILLGIALVVSSIFPTFIEKIFLVVGAVALRIFIWIFKLGKGVFVGALNQAGSGGSPALDEFRDSVLGSFDELPPCMVDVMGYLHLVEDLGLILTTAMLLALVSLFRIVYGGLFVKSGSPL